MLRALTYSESIFNGLLMIILDIRTWYNFCGLDCQKGKKEKKIYRYFEMSFLCFGPFGVWGMTTLDPTNKGSETVDDEKDLVDSKFEKIDEQDDIHIAYEKLYKVSEKYEKLYRLTTYSNFVEYDRQYHNDDRDIASFV